MQFYVKDIMSTDLITIRENDTIKDLIKTFADNNILGLPVLDLEGHVVGVISSIDILKNESSLSFYQDPFMKNSEINFYEDLKFFDKPISSIMSK